ncbi:hypothetical protein CHR53_26200 [Neobacillus mesonae]|uniref:Uncharacterized protein n=1 Tax=Neobacillus mesonae TaxID=1193713 RepID=A0A3Q9QVV1_9BACI|nr:hypothetical protein CHR53_26200 [Neobacillus mesonae]
MLLTTSSIRKILENSKRPAGYRSEGKASVFIVYSKVNGKTVVVVRPNESAILLFCTKMQFLSVAIKASLIASQSYCNERIMMLSKPSYMIDEMIILITEEYDQYGKLCARVMEGAVAFLVNRTPLRLLKEKDRSS